MNKMNFQINDASDDDHNVRNIQVTASGTVLMIHPENTDIYDGDYSPILLEFQNGIPVIYIWNDRKQQEPIKISLENTMIPKEEKTNETP